MVVYNRRERPRTVVLGCGEDHPLYLAVKQLVGWISKEHPNSQPLHERDLVVVWQHPTFKRGEATPLRGVRKNLRVLQFGGQPASVWHPNPQTTGSPRVVQALGEELSVAESCPDNLKGLVHALARLLSDREGSSRTTLQHHWGGDTEATFTPLIVDSKDQALAAIYQHPLIAELWWLPVERNDAETFDFSAWVRAALDAWHADDPEAFPRAPDWTRQEEWMTIEELQLQLVVKQAESDLEQQQIELGERIASAKSALAAAQSHHDSKERFLLSGQGNELAAVVHWVLERLGFEVKDVDKIREQEDREKGGKFRPKLEDLRVSDPETSWVALVEVKGYVGGGKTRDFQKITRFVDIYQAENDSRPDAVWYVVNQFLDRPPGSRPVLMENEPEDVDVFVQNSNGVLIDTRHLFLLDRLVGTDKLSQENARKLLMSAQRRFSINARQHEQEGATGGQGEESGPDADLEN